MGKEKRRTRLHVLYNGHLRSKSILRILGGDSSNRYVPEAFCEKNFTETGNLNYSADEEKVLAMSLGLKMRDEATSLL